LRVEGLRYRAQGLGVTGLPHVARTLLTIGAVPLVQKHHQQGGARESSEAGFEGFGGLRTCGLGFQG
jgi:hypothetical protein